MTTFEAFNRIEEEITSLSLKDYLGEPLIGIEALGAVAKFCGEKWDQLVAEMHEEKITPDEYAQRAIDMISTYKQYLFLIRTEKALTS